MWCGTLPHGESGQVFVLELCKKSLNSPTKLSTNRTFSISFLYKLMLTAPPPRLRLVSAGYNFHVLSQPEDMSARLSRTLSGIRVSLLRRNSDGNTPPRPLLPGHGRECEHTVGREGAAPGYGEGARPLADVGCRSMGAGDRLRGERCSRAGVGRRE